MPYIPLGITNVLQRCFKDALRMGPQHSGALKGLCAAGVSLHGEEGRRDEGCKMIEEAQGIAQQNPNIKANMLQIGESLVGIGNFNGAADWFEKCIAFQSLNVFPILEGFCGRKNIVIWGSERMTVEKRLMYLDSLPREILLELD